MKKYLLVLLVLSAGAAHAMDNKKQEETNQPGFMRMLIWLHAGLEKGGNLTKRFVRLHWPFTKDTFFDHHPSFQD